MSNYHYQFYSSVHMVQLLKLLCNDGLVMQLLHLLQYILSTYLWIIDIAETTAYTLSHIIFSISQAKGTISDMNMLK